MRWIGIGFLLVFALGLWVAGFFQLFVYDDALDGYLCMAGSIALSHVGSEELDDVPSRSPEREQS